MGKGMHQELHALEANHTWVLITLPFGKKTLTSKWVYQIKYKPDGTVDRHTASLVIQGFEQVKDEAYKHTFSPMSKLTTMRLSLPWPLLGVGPYIGQK